MKRLAIVAWLCSFVAVPGSALAQTEDHSQHGGAASSGVGTVAFETSCAPAVKDAFNHAVAELHSFWFPEARAGFEGVLKSDPVVRDRLLGIALTHWGNPFAGLRSPQAIAAGKAAIEKGQATGSPTPREKGYIDAVAGLFSSADPGTQRARAGLREGDRSGGRAEPGRHRSANLLGARDHADRAAHRQVVRAEPAVGGDPRAALQEDAEPPGAGALHHPYLRRAGAGRQGAARPRARTRISPRRCRTRSTCRRTRSRASACGRSRSPPTSSPRRRRRRPAASAKRCMRSTIRPTRTCRWRRTRRPRPCWSTRCQRERRC